MKISTVIAGLSLCLTIIPAQAQIVDAAIVSIADTISDVTEEVMPGVTNIRFGLGPVISPDYLGADSYGVGIKPIVSFHYRDLIQVDNNNIRINVFGNDGLVRTNRFKAGPLLKIDSGRDQDDSDDLAGLGDISTGIELGLFGSYSLGPTRTRIRWQKDVASGHSGTKIIGDFRALVNQTDDLVLVGSIFSTWADNSYMNSYFSITPVQSQQSGLMEYDAGSGIKDVGAAFSAYYNFSEHWAFVANVGYTRLLGDAKDSPLVVVHGSANQYSAGGFVVYRF